MKSKYELLEVFMRKHFHQTYSQDAQIGFNAGYDAHQAHSEVLVRDLLEALKEIENGISQRAAMIAREALKKWGLNE